MKVQVALLLALVAVASAGKIDHRLCQASGTLHEIRVAGSDGAVANMSPGTPYVCEGDMTPSSPHPSMTLKVTATYLGFPVPILETELADSSVQPGVRFTVTFTITPNDILSGNTIDVRLEVRGTVGEITEVCGIISVRVL